MSNINDSYFDGAYKDIWKSLIPAELTVKEVDFLIQYFNLSEKSKVLDLMCGYGRHALALAKKGIAVTSVDNLQAYTDEIKAITASESLSIEVIQADVANYKPSQKYDLVICMGNSLNFFPEKDVRQIFSNVAAYIEPGGSLLINSWSIAEIAIPQFKERSWSKINDLKFITESKYLFNPTRIETESTILKDDTIAEVKMAIDYIFSMAEMEKMLSESGLQLKEAYSIPGRKKFSLGEPRLYIVAEKV